MKQIIFTLILIILTPKVYSQEKVIFNNFSKYEKAQVLQQIEILENVFKDSNTDTLEVYLSSDFTSMGQSMPMAIEVLKQMSAQMPKGSIKVLSASKTKNNLYDLDLEQDTDLYLELCAIKYVLGKSNNTNGEKN